MIKTEDLTTAVLFARDGDSATISVMAHHNYLILQEILSNKIKIHQELSHDDIKKLPKVVCDFQTVESVDVVIEILRRIRKNIEDTYKNSFAMAC